MVWTDSHIRRGVGDTEVPWVDDECVYGGTGLVASGAFWAAHTKELGSVVLVDGWVEEAGVALAGEGRSVAYGWRRRWRVELSLF